MSGNICTVSGCERSQQARGWCRAHYNRWWKFGDPGLKFEPKLDIGDLLRSKLKPTINGCLEFVGASNPSGYGAISFNGRQEGAHRVAYKLWVGSIPEGKIICHSCDNPPCCNINHLYAGTYSDNMQDMIWKGRGALQQRTHCPRGHELSGSNLVADKLRKEQRECLTCRKAHGARYRAVKRRHKRLREELARAGLLEQFDATETWPH